MRFMLPCALLVLLLAGCRGTQDYTSQDLSQVHQGYAEILPTYKAFRQAYLSNNTARILSLYRREQQQCKLPDQIDKRDSIDPNVNLFLASVGLDDMCDTIESGYVTWAKPHGYPYPKDVLPSRPAEVFIGTDTEIKRLPHYLKKSDSFS
jgi:hypothetical protein